MGVFNNFPYTNFHELNQDWIIEEVKKLAVEWAEYQQQYAHLYDDINDAFNAFKAEFDEFIARIDVDAEFRKALDSIIADGTFLNTVSPVISTTTTTWLAQHITQPTDPAIDSSLTVSGAGADAKVTGDYIREIIHNLIHNNTFDIVENNKSNLVSTTRNGVTYTWDLNTCAVTMSGTASPASFNNIYYNTHQLPEGVVPGESIEIEWKTHPSYINVIFYDINETIIMQKYVRGYNTIKVPDNAHGCVIRLYVVQGNSVDNTTRPEVLSHGNNLNIKYMGHVEENGYTLNDMPVNTFATCTGDEANLPLNVAGYVLTVGSFTRMQLFIVASRGRMYYRAGVASGSDWNYGIWNDMAKDWVFLGGGFQALFPTYTGDLNDVQANSVVITSGGATHAPVTTAGYVFTYGVREYPGTRIQYFARFSDGALYYRRSSNGTWTEWTTSSTMGNARAHMYSIGNSILTGSVWNTSGMDHLSAYGNAPYSVIANSLNIPRENVDHTLISDTGFMYDAGNGSFLENILETNLSSYDVVLTHMWLGDMNNFNIGSLSSTAGDGTLAGGVLQLLNYIKGQNKNGQLILCSVPPSSTTIKGNNVFTGHYPNNSSIHDLDVLMHSLAEREHFTYIDYEDWNISYRYQELTPNNNNVHFNNENSYRVMGAYLAGRASSKITF